MSNQIEGAGLQGPEIDGSGHEVALAFRDLIIWSRRQAQQRAALAPYLPELERLAAMDTGTVKALWDAYDGCNDPDGFDAVAIHIDLNRRGEGSYCAV